LLRYAHWHQRNPVKKRKLSAKKFDLRAVASDSQNIALLYGSLNNELCRKTGYCYRQIS
jgi:hypothetical protein